ncbi:UNVERIFIED_CONTAM: hypothetical protein FKN15_056287 [Acipenser sinensis]
MTERSDVTAEEGGTTTKSMSENSLEERTVEVSGVPNEVEDEFLGLFFENKRRSGGGALTSLHRQGNRAVLIFEDAEVAKRVLSKGTHVLHNAKLTVRKPTPKDPGKVLLRGMNASTAKEIVELFVENVTKLDSTEYLMYPSPGRDKFLVQFLQPLSEQEFRRLADKVRRRLLDGARIEAEQIERTDSVIVEDLHSTTTEDMLALYFENKRGGGEEVRDVTMVEDGMARVTFEDWEAVDRILQRSHKLDGRDLSLRPYFDFLLPGESPPSPNTPNVTEVPTDGTGHADGTGLADGTGDMYTDTLGCDTTREDLTDSTREMYLDSPEVYSSNILLHDPVKLNLLQCSHLLQEIQQAHLDFGIQIVGNGVQISGPSQLTSEQLKKRILEVLSGIAQAHLPFSIEKATFLSRSEVQESLQKRLEQEGMLATYTVSDCTVTVTALTIDMVKQASSLVKALVCDFTMPIATEYECMLFSDEWPKFLSSLSLCSAKVSDRGDEINVVTLRGQEEETRSKIEFFLSNPIQQESVITMEPGMLKYLQTHCHMLLADMNQVTIFPLDGEDITGLRLHGQANACQAADELLRNVVASVHTRTITLQRPGVARFLVEEQGTSILNQIQTKFEVVISLERVHWVPLHSEDIFEDAKKFTPPPSFERRLKSLTESLSESFTNTDEQTNDLNRPETDLYTDQLLSLSSSDNEDTLAEIDETPAMTTEGEREGAVGEDPKLNYVKQLSMESLQVDGVLEEDAQLSLAIQFSMENSDPMDGEDELQKVLELSRRTAGQGRTSSTSELDQAIGLSIQDAIKAAHTAQILVYAGYDMDLIRVDIALGKKTELKQCKEKIESKCLKNLSEHHRSCVDLIQRKHAVDISIQGTTATVFDSLLEEAKKLISVIRKDSHELPETATSPPGTEAAGISMDEDLYTDQLLSLSSSDNEDTLAEIEETPAITTEGEREGAVGEDPELNYVKQLSMESLQVDGVLEEDAQLSLAIQFSMENSDPMDGEDELQKVLELSRRTAGQGRTSGTSELDQAIGLSIQDTIKAAHTAQILVYAGYDMDLIRVDIALGKKTELKQCKEKIESKCLKNLSEHHRSCVDLIQRKHAVDITIQGTTATVQGFKEYVSEAVLDMNKLVNHISATVPDPDILRSVQWVWYKEQSNAIPYPPKATIYIEHAFKQKQKKIDMVFDKQPCTISFEKMEEYNIASGKSLPIARKQLSNTDIYSDVTGLLEEAKKLISVIRKDDHELPDTAPSAPGTAAAGISMDEDLYTDQLLPLSSLDNKDTLVEMEETPGITTEGESEGAVGENPELNYVKQLSMESLQVDSILEEDAQLSLAIQFSMENNSNPVDKEDELQKVLELSRRTAGQGRTSGTSELDQAIGLSIQDTIKAAHTAQILVYAGYDMDLIRVDIALGKKTELKQCKETIESKCLKNLSEHHRSCVDLIQRKHAVDITIQGTTATVQGFKEYVSEAVLDMNKLVNHISATVPDPDILRSVQWVWYKEQSNAIPYPPKATIYIEHAFKQKQKKIDMVFDKQPCTISFEKMEEYNIASGKSLPIARKQLSNTDIYSDVTGVYLQ